MSDEKTGEDVEWGPAMAALTVKQREFVVYFFSVRPGNGVATRAARRAGFGKTAGSTRQSAFRLMHNEKITAAMHEYAAEIAMPKIGLRAASALDRLIENPTHRDHARAIGMALDQTMPQTLHVNHTLRAERPVNEEQMRRIAELARRIGIRLPAALPPARPAIIDAEFSIVEPDEPVDDSDLVRRTSDALRASTISRGAKFALIAVAYVKWMLNQPWMTKRDQLKALEYLASEEQILSRETIAAIPALDAAQAELFFEIGKLDDPRDKGRRSFEIVASNEFFSGIVGKNPAFVTVLETI